MQETDFETECKVIVVGNGQVGKTSMVTRFATGVFTNNYKKTIGTDFMERTLYVKSKSENVKLMLWDTAGQEMFSQLTRQYYRGAGAVVFAFSTTDRESFLAIEKWKSKVAEECGDIPAVLVQNKIDLLSQAQVEASEVEDLARRMGIKLYRTCVKDNILVDDVFEYLAESFLKRGGSAALGVSAVPSIASLSTREVSTSNARPAEAASAAASNSQPAAASGDAGNGAFKLGGPSKQRTGGKKSTPCAIL